MQPKWKTIAAWDNTRIMIDETGHYPPEAEVSEEIEPEDFENDKPAVFQLFRVCLDPVELHDGVLGRIAANSRFYREWYEDDLTSAAESCGITPDALRKDFTSEDPIARFRAYETIASYHGWINFDQYPIRLTEPELDERWKDCDARPA